jgi:hypothetical protein
VAKGWPPHFSTWDDIPQSADTYKDVPLDLMSGPDREHYYANCWPPLPEAMIEDLEDEIMESKYG